MKKHIFIGVGILLYTALRAQQGSVSSGGEINGHTGNVSFSFGQTHYSSFPENVTEGIQQTHEIPVVNSTDEFNEEINVSVFPNPVVNELFLENNSIFTDLSYEVYNGTGVLIMSGETTDERDVLDLSNQPSGVYMLRIAQGNRLIKTIKVIKRN